MRQGRGKAHVLARDRVFEPEDVGVEAKPLVTVDFRAVFFVADDRVAGFGGVDADLVFPAGLEFEPDDGESVFDAAELIVGDGELAGGGRFDEEHIVFGKDAFPRPFPGLQDAFDKAVVFSVDRVVGKVVFEFFSGLFSVGKDHDARGVAV